MRIIDKNFTITTIYFDGQFWCALIEQNREGQNYAGRYVFCKRAGNIPKSFKAFSKAQKEYAEERKAQNRKQKTIEAKEKYLAKKERKK